MPTQSAVTLFRATGEQELALIRESEWNTKDGGIGYVLRFQVDAEFLARYTVQTVGTRVHQEYWIPAEDLEEFNRNPIGPIEIVSSFTGVSGR